MHISDFFELYQKLVETKEPQSSLNLAFDRVINAYTEITNMDIIEVQKPAIILHICNCKGVIGAGVSGSLIGKWKKVREEYLKNRNNLTPGTIMPVLVEEGIWVVNMMAQINYGNPNKSNKMYVDYSLLEECLQDVAAWKTNVYSIHDQYGFMDSITKEGYAVTTLVQTDIYHSPFYIPYFMGCGLGGGSWEVVKNLIKQNLDVIFICKRNIDSTAM